MPEQGIAEKLTRRAGWAMTSFRDWLGYRREHAAFNDRTRGRSLKRIEEPLGHRTRHVYTVTANDERRDAFTTFQMDQRCRIVERLYPEKVTSLLDIGCCRGWFVIRAAMRPECERAVGIDVVQGFIDAANDAKRLLKLEDKVQFEYAFLDDLVNEPERFRPPYQTIVLLNTYHYMYWGSSYSPKHWPDHDYMLRTLRDLCTDRIIFMSPLEVSECPSDIAKRAAEHPDWAKGFTTEQFLQTAGKYFDVTHETYLGLRPLYLMKRKA